MRVAVLHNLIPDSASLDEQDNLVQAKAVSGALEERGHEILSLACPLNLEEVETRLKKIHPDLVFNLVESIGGVGRYIHFAASLLDNLGYPYTGCPANAIYTSSDKTLAKRMLRLNGIPTPHWTTIEDLRSGKRLPPGRLIIKSVWEHASLGLEESSIVESADSIKIATELERRSEELGRGAFAEKFIDGREFNLSLIEGENGPLVLPPAEMCFDGFSEDRPRIVGYRAKWISDSFEYKHTVRKFDFDTEDQPLVEQLSKIALKCWQIFDLRGYARVDFRVDRAGRPYVLEINTNPCISPDAGFTAAAAQSGMDYSEMIDGIVKAATRKKSSQSQEMHAARSEDPPPNPVYNGGTTFRDHITGEDRSAFEKLATGTGFFYEAEVDILMELFDDVIQNGAGNGYHVLVAEIDGRVAGFAIYGPIPGTQSSYDLYWIATHRDFQRQGIGSKIINQTESRIKALGGVRLYVDTSGRSLYSPTQRFYEANGYIKEAALRDFYSSSDDKLIYVKELLD